jgi:hypothetical protein
MSRLARSGALLLGAALAAISGAVGDLHPVQRVIPLESRRTRSRKPFQGKQEMARRRRQMAARARAASVH